MEEENKIAEIFGVEQRHYDEVIKQTKNLTLDKIHLSLGTLYSDCIKFKIASEQLGYDAQEIGCEYKGHPSSFYLTKHKN